MQLLAWPKEAPVGFSLALILFLLIAWMVSSLIRHDPENGQSAVMIWGREVVLRSGLVLLFISLVPRKILLIVRRPP